MPRCRGSTSTGRSRPTRSRPSAGCSERYGELVFLVGADRFADFLSWERPNDVLRIARLGVATRPGYDLAELDEVLAAVELPEQVSFFELEPVAVSSTDIRRRIAAGEPIEGLVPPAVERLIAELGLYRDAPPAPLH